MRVDAVWAERIEGALISVVMSGVMSAVMVGLNEGLRVDFPLAWA